MMRVGAFLAIILVVALPMAAISKAGAETLTIATVSDNAKKHYIRLAPLAEYLQQSLGHAGVDDVRAAVLPSTDAMAAAMANGKVDLYFDSAVAIAAVARSADARPFLRRWKKGVASYHAVILVPSESDIETLDDLCGHTIGFQDPDSTSGFMLPVSLLLQRGHAVRELAERGAPVAPNEVGYVFTGDDDTSVMWLHHGLVDAIATDPRHAAALERAKPGAMRLVARSIEVPRQVVAHGATMDPALRHAIAQTLIAMETTEAGRDVLAAFAGTTRFDSFPNGDEATFAPIFAVLDQLAAHGLR